MPKKVEATLESITIRHCSNKLIILTPERFSFNSDSGGCGMCGSHGQIELSINGKCPLCDKYIGNIELDSW